MKDRIKRIGSVLALAGMLWLVCAGADGKRTAAEQSVRTAGQNVQTEGQDMADGSETESRGKIALTFDDGPSPDCTEQLLDGLKKRGVKATFFVLGEHAEAYPDIIRRMSGEGHLIGNHTYSHLQLSEANRETFRAELVKTNRIIMEITGQEVVYVRPPYGTWDQRLEEELNMFPVLWNIDPLDWCSTNAECIADHVVSKARPDAVILLHDNYPSTVTAALAIVDELQGEGYEFVTVEEILFD